jgi:hypothetical protein
MEPDPEIRGPLISLLTQLYDGLDEGRVGETIDEGDLAGGATVELRDPEASIQDLAVMFMTYVKQTEADHGGNFLEFLRRQAEDAFRPDDDPAGFPEHHAPSPARERRPSSGLTTAAPFQRSTLVSPPDRRQPSYTAARQTGPAAPSIPQVGGCLTRCEKARTQMARTVSLDHLLAMFRLVVPSASIRGCSVAQCRSARSALQSSKARLRAVPVGCAVNDRAVLCPVTCGDHLGGG